MRRGRRLPLDALAPYLLEVPEAAGPVRWADVFGDDGDVEIEIGFGKGLFLLQAAQERPEVNFVGVEIARKYQLFTATRMAKRGFSNVRLAKADAREFLRDRVATASVAAVHVYFPDPWWKKRHHKRRLITAEFAAQCARVLRTDGRFFFATDVEEYFQRALGILTAERALRRTDDGNRAAANAEDLTNFERKFRLQGRPIFRAVFERIGNYSRADQPA